MSSLDDLFLTLLREVHFAERQIGKALPRMVLAARNASLREAFARRREAALTQQSRLRTAFRLMDRPARAESSEAILGLLQDCQEVIEHVTAPSPVHDARLIACGQAVAYHQMSRYGTLLAWAEAMERPDVAALLRQTLDEERTAERVLARLAALTINREARAAA